MVYTTYFKKYFYKQDLSNLSKMIEDQESTFIILKYCDEVPSRIYRDTVTLLLDRYKEITFKPLKDLVCNTIGM